MKLLKAKKRIGIGIRLAIMVAVLLTVSSGSFAVLSLMSQRREAMSIFVRTCLNMCRSLERVLHYSMLENRRGEIESALKQIVSEYDIESATLVTHTGKLVYSSKSQFESPVPIDDARCIGCHVSKERILKRLPAGAHSCLIEERKIAGVWLPIYNAPECYNAACHAHAASETVLGVMQLGVSYAKIDESLRESHKRLIVFSILVALITSVVVLLLIRRWVTNPVKELLDGTRRVADGEMGHVIPVGEAELGELSRSFNKMQVKLVSSQRQLVMIEKLASIGKLAASVAHEINNPLTGILTFAEDLIDTATPDDPRLTDYRVVRREAIRCREIVRQLLDFSRQDKPNLQPADMNEVLSHTVRFVSRQAVFRNIKIETDLSDNLPTVTADPVQLEQVVLDLLVNACEAMPDGGKILIASSAPPLTNEVEVTVKDNGPGIPPEYLPQIFEPFFSTKGGKSMGIGLAVSWNIINQHGGRLEVDSKAGEGTTFRIVMPRSKQARAIADSAT